MFLTFLARLLLKKDTEFKWISLGVNMGCVSLGLIFMSIDDQLNNIYIFFFAIVALFVCMLIEAGYKYAEKSDKGWQLFINCLLAFGFFAATFYVIDTEDRPFFIPTDNGIDIKNKYVEFLINPESKYNSDELTKEYKEHINNKNNENIGDEEGSLFAACIEYKRGNEEVTEKHLNKISSDKLKNDKSFIFSLIYKDNDEKLSKLVISSNTTWLGIPKDTIDKAITRIKDAKNRIEDAKKEKQIKILILDATGGKNEDIKDNTAKALELQKYLESKKYPIGSITVLRFNHTLAKAQQYPALYQLKSNTQKDGMDELIKIITEQHMQNYKKTIKREQNSNYLKIQIDDGGYDIAIVISPYS